MARETASRAASETTPREPTTTNGVGRDDPARDAHAIQRDEYGGLNWGSAFFGWLVAAGIATLPAAILRAAGTAIGLTKASPSPAAGSADTIGIVRAPPFPLL